MVLTVSPETWPSATTQLRQCLSSPDAPLSSYSVSDGLPPVPSTTWSRFSAALPLRRDRCRMGNRTAPSASVRK
jgi:hypothetical protein